MKWFTPGRLEVLGKHTDYAGGKSIIAAADRGIYVQAREWTEGVHVTSTAAPGKDVHWLGTEIQFPAGHWGNYVCTAIERLEANFGRSLPVRLEIDSDLPLASGMSSSSALIVSIAMALAQYNGWDQTPLWRQSIENSLDLAAYFATIENGLTFRALEGKRGVGTFGGSEDHTAMLNSDVNSVKVFSFAPIQFHQAIQISLDLQFIIAVSGVTAQKTAAARAQYNRVSLTCREIVDRWNKETQQQLPHLAAVVESPEFSHRQLKTLLGADSALKERLDAFMVENYEIIPAAAQSLAKRDYSSFGAAVDLSHCRADALLKNQVPQTNFLQNEARSLGAIASSAFGAGFGGAVWALVERKDAEGFTQAWKKRYQTSHSDYADRADVFGIELAGSASCMG